jgi:4-amino-4-deoxy-L-arabinose transferase-like glycosyltransferase
MTNRTRTDALLLAGFCAFLFFYGLAQFGLIGADEPRYAQVAHEMLERGDWITPTLGGRTWLEKPPLYYWQAMIAYKIFGVSDWAARLPSAFDATLLVLAVYFFLRRFRSGAELDGALIAASCAGIIGYARAASTDMSLAAAFSIGMLSWWAWRESKKQKYLLLFYAFIALGMLAKGPVALFLACTIILLYAIASRDSSFALTTFWSPGVLIFCAIALPWYAAAQLRNTNFLHEFIVEQNLGRFSHNLYHHTQPFWYYLPVTILALIPWTIFVLAAFVESIRKWRAMPKPAGRSEQKDDGNLFACCWLIVPILFFSFSQSKLPG